MSHISFLTPLGSLTVFEDAEMLVALEWGEVPENRPSALLSLVREGLLRYFDGTPLPLDWPTNPGGTFYQRRVWDRIRRVPFGQTTSYGALAFELSSAPRAIAGACAHNPLPLIIPCHRVIAADGSLGGYSGGDGPETKAALLNIEGSVFASPHTRAKSILP